MLVEFAFQSLPKSSDIGNNGGTDENIAELEETRVASSISGSSPSPPLPSDSIARGVEIRQQGELAGW